MDRIKFMKAAFSKLRPSPRLIPYDPNSGDVQLSPPEDQWHWCAPKLNRREDVHLILANHNNKISIIIDLKWRPDIESSLVCLQTNLVLNIKDETRTFEQLECYEPRPSTRRKGEILTYGSHGSCFKLIYESVCRRYRINFKGYMKTEGGADEFVQLSFVGCPTSQLYDFKNQIDQENFKQQWLDKGPQANIDLDRVIDEQVFDDRIDQLVRFTGEICISGEKKSPIFIWGFHSRIFGDKKPAHISQKHYLCHLTNGQAFHLIASHNDNDQFIIQTGYTCFAIYPRLVPIQKHDPNLNNELEFNELLDKFDIELENQDVKMLLKANKRSDIRPGLSIYDVEFNETLGWCFSFVTNSSKINEENMVECLSNYKKLIEEGLFAVDRKLNMNDNGGTSNQVFGIGQEDQSFCEELVGGKASSLAQLTLLAKHELSRFQIPIGIVITTIKFSDENDAKLDKEMKDLEELLGSNPEKEILRAQCNKLVALVEQSEFPVDLRNKIVDKLGDDCDKQAFAVRSSSWGEDTQDMSAAGQLSTLLNVRGLENLESAILKCFASKFSIENVEYKRQHGLSPNLPMAVVVQSMVQCDKAGVMFTCDPITGDQTIISISANYGLGESVVSGQADPDQIRVRRLAGGDGSEEFEIVEIKPGRKSVIIAESDEKFENLDKTECCLSREQILQIAKCGQLVTRFHGEPRDIEWGFQDDQLYLFQSRPITGLLLYSEYELLHEADRTSRAEDEWRTRVNLNEVTPYAFTPLSVTTMTSSFAVGMAKAMRKYNNVIDVVPETCNDFIVDSYHGFLSLRKNVILAFGMGDDQDCRSLGQRSNEISFFGREVGPQPGVHRASKNIPEPKSIFEGARWDLMTAPIRLAPIAYFSRKIGDFEVIEATMKQSLKASKEMPNRMQSSYELSYIALKHMMDDINNHLITLMIGGQYNHALHDFLAKYINNDEPRVLYAAMNKFLGNTSALSAQIPHEIDGLASLIKQIGPEFCDRFANSMDPSEALRYLQDETIDDASVDPTKLFLLREKFSQFMKKFGHRSYNEFEVKAKGWQDEPEKLIKMLQQNVSVSIESNNKDEQSTTNGIRKQKLNNSEIIKELGLNLTMKDSFMLRNVLAPRCQNFIAAREITKDVMIRYIDLCRFVMRSLAYELRKNLRIPDDDLFYYFFYDELESLITCPQPELVCRALRRRQLHKKMFNGEAWKFDEIIEGCELKPFHLQQQKDVDVNAERIYGIPACPGRVQGFTRIVSNYSELSKVKSGEILVTYSTDIAFSPIFPIISGVVTEVGGMISHGAVVAREYALPSLLGVVDACKILEDGEEIILDADLGQIVRLSKIRTDN